MTTMLMKLAALLLCLTVAMWAADPWLGTWKMNVAKSKFDPGPPPKSRVRTTEMVGDQIKWTTESVSAEGQTTKTTRIGKMDGKEYPVQGSTGKMMVSAHQVRPTVQEAVAKIDGKPYYTAKSVLSKDGKTMTTTVKGSRDGKPFQFTAVFEKQ